MDLPTIGLGTMEIDDSTPIATALDLGYRHLDTARIYDNEAVVGEGLAASDVAPENVAVATKLWVDDLAPDDVEPAARESADRLGVDHVDLLYVHRPYDPYDPEATLGALAALRADGLVGAVGVSNFEPAEIDAAVAVLDEHGIPLAAHQTELHPLFYRPELLRHAREHDYTVVAYAPLAGGRAGEIDAVVEIAERRGVTPEAVSLAWVCSKDPVVAVPKASSEAHQRANLTAAELRLTPTEVAAIDAVEREIELYPE